MTPTSSATSEITAMSWLTNWMAMPSSACGREHELENLRLDGDIECCGRLVGDEEGGLAGERHRDHGALAHAARELMRVVAGTPLGGRDADARKGRECRLGGLAAVHAAMEAQRLGDLLADGEDRVERRHRLLEDHGDAIAAECGDLARAERGELDAVEPDAAADDASGRRHETQERECQDRLARSALADDAERAAARERIGDVLDRREPPLARGEDDAQLAHCQERRFLLAGYGLARHVSTQSVLGSSWPVGTMPSSHVGMMKGSAR